MTEFHQENISRFSSFSADLVERLTNGKPLSLYVDGIVSRVKSNGESLKTFIVLKSNRRILFRMSFRSLTNKLTTPLIYNGFILFLCSFSGSTFKYVKG